MFFLKFKSLWHHKKKNSKKIQFQFPLIITQTNLMFTSHSMDRRSSISFSIYIFHFRSRLSRHKKRDTQKRIPFSSSNPGDDDVYLHFVKRLLFLVSRTRPLGGVGQVKKRGQKHDEDWMSKVSSWKCSKALFQSCAISSEFSSAIQVQTRKWKQKHFLSPLRSCVGEMRRIVGNMRMENWFFAFPFFALRKNSLRVFSVIGKDVVITRRWKKLFREKKRTKISYHFSNISRKLKDRKSLIKVAFLLVWFISASFSGSDNRSPAVADGNKRCKVRIVYEFFIKRNFFSGWHENRPTNARECGTKFIQRRFFTVLVGCRICLFILILRHPQQRRELFSEIEGRAARDHWILKRKNSRNFPIDGIFDELKLCSVFSVVVFFHP